jgi:hypothetical protein
MMDRKPPKRAPRDRYHLGDVSATNLHDGSWLFMRTGEPNHIGRRRYHLYEIVEILEWLADRKAGYPKRDLPWPELNFGSGPNYSDLTGATWAQRHPWGTGRYQP